MRYCRKTWRRARDQAKLGSDGGSEWPAWVKAWPEMLKVFLVMQPFDEDLAASWGIKDMVLVFIDRLLLFVFHVWGLVWFVLSQEPSQSPQKEINYEGVSVGELESLMAEGGYNLVHEIHRVMAHPWFKSYPKFGTFGHYPKTWLEDLKTWLVWFQTETAKVGPPKQLVENVRMKFLPSAQLW